MRISSAPRDGAPAAPWPRLGSRRTGFVVELFGLPGVGKSRLATELLRASADVGVRLDRPAAKVDHESPTAWRVGRKLGVATRECIRHPLRSSVAARAILRSQSTGALAGVPRWVHWLVVQGLMSSAQATPGIHLFDEGLLQALWSVGLRGDPTPAIERVAAFPDRWALSDVVVFVDAPLDEIDRRLSQRVSRHSRIQTGDDPQARRVELERGRELATSILGWWADTTARPILHVENQPGALLAEAAPPIIQLILRHVEAQDGNGGNGRSP